MPKTEKITKSDFPNSLVEVVPYLEKRFNGKPKTGETDKEFREIVKQIEYHFVNIGIFGSHSGGQLVEFLQRHITFE